MKQFYTSKSPLSTVFEWLLAIVLAVVFIRMILMYLYQHLGIIIILGCLVIGGIVGYRIYDYKKKHRF